MSVVMYYQRTLTRAPAAANFIRQQPVDPRSAPGGAPESTEQLFGGSSLNPVSVEFGDGGGNKRHCEGWEEFVLASPVG